MPIDAPDQTHMVPAASAESCCIELECILLGAIACHLAWPALVHKRISMMTMANLPWHLRIMGAVLGATVDPAEQTATHFRGVPNAELVGSWSFTETTYLALLTKRPSVGERLAFQVLLGLVVSNGPGTISSQGAKGAVSADGPEAPECVQVNKAYVGFLTHCGYAHGGNGFEAIQFALGRFGDTDLPDPGNREHGIDLARIAADYAQEHKVYKSKAKAAGNLSYAKFPCINHPVFKGKEVDYDPREVFVSESFEQHQAYNIVHDFYHERVKALAFFGVSENVYCVNVDAVIAVILLKMLWQPNRTGLQRLGHGLPPIDTGGDERGVSRDRGGAIRAELTQHPRRYNGSVPSLRMSRYRRYENTRSRLRPVISLTMPSRCSASTARATVG